MNVEHINGKAAAVGLGCVAGILWLAYTLRKRAQAQDWEETADMLSKAIETSPEAKLSAKRISTGTEHADRVHCLARRRQKRT